MDDFPNVFSAVFARMSAGSLDDAAFKEWDLVCLNELHRLNLQRLIMTASDLLGERVVCVHSLNRRPRIAASRLNAGMNVRLKGDAAALDESGGCDLALNSYVAMNRHA